MFGKINKIRENRALKTVRAHFARLTNIPRVIQPTSTAPLRLEILETANEVMSLLDISENTPLAVEMVFRLRVSREIVDTVHNIGYGSVATHGCLESTPADIASRKMWPTAAQNLSALVARAYENAQDGPRLLQLHKENMLTGIRAINSYQLAREVYQI